MSHRGNQADVPRLCLLALPGVLPTQLVHSLTIGEAFSEGISRAGHGGCGIESCVRHPKTRAVEGPLATAHRDAALAVPLRRACNGCFQGSRAYVLLRRSLRVAALT